MTAILSDEKVAERIRISAKQNPKSSEEKEAWRKWVRGMARLDNLRDKEQRQ